jgi:hypothetical protein
MLKTLRDPGYLLNQSFHGPKAFGAAPAIAPPPGVRIAGQLPAVPTPNPNIIQGEYVGEQPVRPIVTPSPITEPINMPTNPKLPAGPQREQIAGPGALKQLPPARSIQAGPSSLTPEGAPKPAPTNGAVKPAREAANPPTFTSKKTIANEKPPSEYRGANATEATDKLTDAIMAKGKNRNFASERADQIETILANPEKYNRFEVQQAKNAKEMWLGPERRKAPRD